MNQLDSMTARRFATDVREIAARLGIEVSPNEYVELEDAGEELILTGRVVVKLTRIAS